MRLEIDLRRNRDGLVRTIVEDITPDYGKGSIGEGMTQDEWLEAITYNWSEGNYSCDCNRYLFFQRAANEPETELTVRCGETRYTIVRWAVDGKRIDAMEEKS